MVATELQLRLLSWSSAPTKVHIPDPTYRALPFKYDRNLGVLSTKTPDPHQFLYVRASATSLGNIAVHLASHLEAWKGL